MKEFKIINSEVSGSKKLKFRTRKEAEDFTKRIGGDVIEIDAKNLKVKKSTKKINKTSQVFLGTNLKMPNFRL